MSRTLSRRKFLVTGLAFLTSACSLPSILQPGRQPARIQQPPGPGQGRAGGTTPAASMPGQPLVPTAGPVRLTPTASSNPEAGAYRPPLTKPNIIYLVTDDLNTETLAHMPNLDAQLRRQGITFGNYLFNFALCCPSRTAVLTGMYAHNSGIYSNSGADGGFGQIYQRGLEKDMLGVWLQAAGYKTALIGKYLNGYPDKKNESYIPPGWSEWYSSARGNAYSEYKYTLNENGKMVDYGEKPEDYGTDVYARHALNFMQRSIDNGQPFFTYLSVYAPHGPATPAPRHAGLFAGIQAPRPPNFNEEDISDKPLSLQSAKRLTEKEIAKIDQDYRLRLQSVQAVDEMIAGIFQLLERTGQIDHTYFIFTSDNGFHQGQHRIPNGKTRPYEEDICCPMFVRGPGISAGQVSRALVGNVDLAPSIAGLAGASVPARVDGRSFVGLLNGSDPAQWRQAFLLENGAPVSIPAAPNPKARNTAKAAGWSQGIRTRTSTYVEYKNGDREFYDLERDPYQLQNSAARLSPQEVQALSAYLNRLRQSGGRAVRLAEEQPLPELKLG